MKKILLLLITCATIHITAMDKLAAIEKLEKHLKGNKKHLERISEKLSINDSKREEIWLKDAQKRTIRQIENIQKVIPCIKKNQPYQLNDGINTYLANGVRMSNIIYGKDRLNNREKSYNILFFNEKGQSISEQDMKNQMQKNNGVARPGVVCPVASYQATLYDEIYRFISGTEIPQKTLPIILGTTECDKCNELLSHYYQKK